MIHVVANVMGLYKGPVSSQWGRYFFVMRRRDPLHGLFESQRRFLARYPNLARQRSEYHRYLNR